MDRLFQRSSDRSVLWICIWFLCTDLYVCRLFQRLCISYYYDDDIKVPIMLTVIMDTFYNLAVYGLQFLLRGRLGLGTYFTRIIVPEVFYTVFLTVIVYRIFHYINYHFMSATRKESESIWVLK